MLRFTPAGLNPRAPGWRGGPPLHTAKRKSSLRIAAFCSILILAGSAGCLFRKHKAAVPKPAPAPIRVVLLPFNIPAESADLHWMALASPIAMAQAATVARDLELVPLWEGIPIARDSLGASRTMNEEMAAYVASRLAARWATLGEISKSKNAYEMVLDFIPAKTTSVPFRYKSETNVDALVLRFREAFVQFSRYQVLRPPLRQEARSKESLPLKEIAEALDREYGWFATADPGKSGKIVNQLVQTDTRLAKLLFNPSFYPSLGGRSEPKPAVSETPAAAPVPEKPKPEPVQAPPARAETSATGPAPAPSRMERAEPRAAPPAPRAATVPELRPPPVDLAFAPPAVIPTPEDGTLAVPPPKSFTQRMNPAAPQTARKPASQVSPAIARAEISNERIRPAETEPGRPSTPRKDLAPPAGKTPPDSAPKGHRIQVLATRSGEEAQSLSSKLSLAGFSPAIEKADLADKGVWYRLRLQGFANRQDARAAGEKLVGEGIIKEFWIVPQGVR